MADTDLVVSVGLELDEAQARRELQGLGRQLERDLAGAGARAGQNAAKAVSASISQGMGRIKEATDRFAQVLGRGLFAGAAYGGASFRTFLKSGSDDALRFKIRLGELERAQSELGRKLSTEVKLFGGKTAYDWVGVLAQRLENLDTSELQRIVDLGKAAAVAWGSLKLVSTTAGLTKSGLDIAQSLQQLSRLNDIAQSLQQLSRLNAATNIAGGAIGAIGAIGAAGAVGGKVAGIGRIAVSKASTTDWSSRFKQAIAANKAAKITQAEFRKLMLGEHGLLRSAGLDSVLNSTYSMRAAAGMPLQPIRSAGSIFARELLAGGTITALLTKLGLGTAAGIGIFGGALKASSAIQGPRSLGYAPGLSEMYAATRKYTPSYFTPAPVTDIMTRRERDLRVSANIADLRMQKAVRGTQALNRRISDYAYRSDVRDLGGDLNLDEATARVAELKRLRGDVMKQMAAVIQAMAADAKSGRSENAELRQLLDQLREQNLGLGRDVGEAAARVNAIRDATKARDDARVNAIMSATKARDRLMADFEYENTQNADDRLYARDQYKRRLLAVDRRAWELQNISTGAGASTLNLGAGVGDVQRIAATGLQQAQDNMLRYIKESADAAIALKDLSQERADIDSEWIRQQAEWRKVDVAARQRFEEQMRAIMETITGAGAGTPVPH